MQRDEAERGCDECAEGEAGKEGGMRKEVGKQCERGKEMEEERCVSANE